MSSTPTSLFNQTFPTSHGPSSSSANIVQTSIGPHSVRTLATPRDQHSGMRHMQPRTSLSESSMTASSGSNNAHSSRQQTPRESRSTRSGGIKRTAIACNRCRIRKIRCYGQEDGQDRCANCRKSGERTCTRLRVSTFEVDLPGARAGAHPTSSSSSTDTCNWATPSQPTFQPSAYGPLQPDADTLARAYPASSAQWQTTSSTDFRYPDATIIPAQDLPYWTSAATAPDPQIAQWHVPIEAQQPMPVLRVHQARFPDPGLSSSLAAHFPSIPATSDAYGGFFSSAPGESLYTNAYGIGLQAEPNMGPFSSAPMPWGLQPLTDLETTPHNWDYPPDPQWEAQPGLPGRGFY
ncbi:hypothetical protein K461DRAFT_289442 [Myriangium duriaei CBS 260.36]|uniref:Zn(2)-C6 fungal-type domain-containing protein n=1 Tax=Myriangium duriaei CBS 260.36 TaxID=1168546 RepID=A0A9P4ML98_9PEZI|nr:hypothetical protein K461DRAFT_289442 [Myriangium duriaei CBS 260.36]